MPRILVLGATGYVGHTTALTLVRSGQHTVYGVARSAAKARQLAQDEIVPVICADPVNEPAAYHDAIRTSRIDVVIDCAGANQDSQKLLSGLVAVGRERQRACEAAGLTKSPKLGFVYTSGAWVHGSSRTPTPFSTDLDPVGPPLAPLAPPRLVAWRPAVEQAVLAAADVLDVAIVRPALVYGRSSGIWQPFFAPVVQAVREQGRRAETVRVPLEADARPELVHVDDLADGLRCAVEKLPLLAGTGVYPVFDLVGSTVSMREVFDGFARVVGFAGRIELVGAGDDVFAQAMSTSGSSSSARAKQLLGWEPKRTGFMEGMDVYATAILAAAQ